MLAVEWSNVHLAGAFFLGTIFGAVVVLRLLRIAVTAIKRSRDDDT